MFGSEKGLHAGPTPPAAGLFLAAVESGAPNKPTITSATLAKELRSARSRRPLGRGNPGGVVNRRAKATRGVRPARHTEDTRPVWVGTASSPPPSIADRRQTHDLRKSHHRQDDQDLLHTYVLPSLGNCPRVRGTAPPNFSSKRIPNLQSFPFEDAATGRHQE